ncbi:MAG: VCBS repeat-containing protein [Bacteroidetes bacterium]|nr:VCBS repeat-containing protein [Bacteroidota bacterium]
MQTLSTSQKVCFSLFFVLIPFFSKAQLVSDFSVDADGWSSIVVSAGQSYAPTYNATGGNPGGYLSVDLSSSLPTPYYFYADRYFGAPAKFLGNKSFSYNQNLTFDLQQTQNGSDNSAALVVIMGGGLSIYYNPASSFPSTSSWSSYTVLLKETAGWKTGSLAGPATTLNEMKTALSNITSLRIRGQFIGNFAGTYSGRLDNVVLNVVTLATPPSVTSFSPLSGIPNSASVTINGNNFNPSVSNNAVYFGGVKATITSASSTQLVAQVPKGAQYAPITVVDLTTGLEASSIAPFQPRFDNNKDYGGQIIRATMAPVVTFDLEAAAGTTAAGDIDGDGLNDIVVGEGGGGQHKFSVFRNAGITGDITSASFFPKVSFDCLNPNVKGFVAMADFDGDGKLDVAVSSATGSAYVSVFRNTSTVGTISFAPPIQFLGYSYSDGPLAAADIDGDGRPEILAVFNNNCATGDRLYIYENLSSPGNIDFAAFSTFGNVYTCGGHITVGDLDGDKLTDVVVEAGVVTVFKNSSTPGNLIMATPFVLGNTANGRPVIADLDNDGKPDVGWPKSFTDVEIRKNIYTGGAFDATSFSSAIIITAGIGSDNGTSELVADDINSDGKLDLVLSGNTDLGILQNISTTGTLNTTSFLTGVPYAMNLGTPYSEAPVIADFDGDNKPDVLIKTTNSSPAKVLIFRNESYPAPRIDNLSATSGTTASTVNLTGDYLSTGSSPNISGRLGTTATTITPSSNTLATAAVPLTAVGGRISITEHGLSAFSKPFSVLFGTNKVIDAASFSGSIDFPLAFGSRDILSIADFDDDGKPDVVAADAVSKIFQNTHATAGQPISSSSLTLQGTTYGTSYNLIPFDVDGDGKIDFHNGSGLLKNNSTTGSISFLYGPGGIYTYSAGFNYSAPADFNKDGKTDLAVINGTAFVQVYENRSTKEAFINNGYLSTFSTNAVNLVKPSNYGGIVAVDFDNDGYDDIATCTTNTDNFTVYLNLKLYGPIQASSFSSGTNVATGDQPNNLTANDFDGDGKIDIAVTHFNATFVSVYLNTSTLGSISFAAPVNLTSVNKGYNIASQDLDGDGKAEIVVVHQPNPGPGSFTIFKNNSTTGSANFAAAVNYPLSRNPQALSIADINSDQKPDILIVASGGSTAPANALMVFENKITTPVITITSQPISVYSVCDGATPAISTAASGTTNITYQWQIFNSGLGAYVDLSNTGGYSNVSTSSFTINSIGNFGAGTYRCKVNGDFAATVYSNTVSFTVNPVPTAPTSSNVSNCGPGSITITASGGSNGNYLWYDQNGLIAAQNNSTYTTPVISSTTGYSVAITDGTCVSAKANMTATINSVPAAPTASGVSACPGAFTLTSSGGSNGQYLWYDTNGLIAGQNNSTYITPAISSTTIYSVAINNGTCVSAKTTITATVLSTGCGSGSAPVIAPETSTTPIGSTDTINLLPLLSDPDNNLDLSTLKIVSQPTSGATATIDANHNLVVDYYGLPFAGTDHVTIEVCDLTNLCAQKVINIEVAGDVLVYNGISPDGANPKFIIQNIESLPETQKNKVYIFDRWENLVWHGTNYDNSAIVFTGHSDSGNALPSGVYFYKIEFTSGRNTKTGFISLRR